VRALVDRWRRFPLGVATAPCPDDPSRYEPVGDSEERVSPTTQLRL
jgi:hypothetical protein